MAQHLFEMTQVLLARRSLIGAVAVIAAATASVACSAESGGGDDDVGALLPTTSGTTTGSTMGGTSNPPVNPPPGPGSTPVTPGSNPVVTPPPVTPGSNPVPTTPVGGAGMTGVEPEPQPDVGVGGNPGTEPSSGEGGAGAEGTAGAGTANGGAGTGGAPVVEPPVDPGSVDCGPNGVVIENAGPASNRVNYVIIGDGYTAAELDTTFMDHIADAMVKRFSDPIGQPYLRYRKFVNICAVKLESPGAICGNSALDCCGDDQSRLANCNEGAAEDAISANFESVPDFDVDWNAVVLNGDSWWNTGARLMLWSGGGNDADGAALHEGGHGFHDLADEYGGCSGGRQVNVSTNNSDSEGKWDIWLGYDQQPGTGVQDFFQCDGNVYRPTDNSMMNLLFGEDPDTSYNAVSREKMIFDIWRFVEPIDSVDPPEGATTSTVLRVNVIDPEVISVNWTVDGQMVEENGGAEFDVSTMGSGSHEVTAFAYDNAGEDLVRYRDGGDFGRENWERSQQTVSWTVTVP